MVSVWDVVTDQRDAASGDGRSLHGTLIAKMKRGAFLATNVRSR